MTPFFNRLIQHLRGGSNFEPSAPADFAQTSSQRDQRPLKGNGQAHFAASMLLRGVGLTVQSYDKLLRTMG